MALGVGEHFAGYTVVRLLGSGGMGEVYLARHPRLPREDALKLLRPELSADDDFRQRFVREADLASSLAHPHIVTVYDRGESDGQLWIATQYIDGTDAADLLRAQYPAGMPLSLAVPTVAGVAEALDYAHERGLLHRDVKPANILLSNPDRAGNRRAYLGDFGIARPLADPNGLTATNATLGTFAYSAPEQLMGDDLDGRADQYALAATAYHLLAGLPPFSATTNPVALISKHLNATPPPLSAYRPDLAPLDDVLARGLAKDPTQRYPSCADFAAALAEQASRTPRDSPEGQTQAAATAGPDYPPNAPTQERPPPQPDQRPAAQARTATPTKSVSTTRARLNAAIAVAAAIGIISMFGWWASSNHSAPSTSRSETSIAPSTVGAAPVSPAPSTAPARASDIAGMIVFLDPAGSGSNDSAMSRDVPNGRGGSGKCQEPGAATNSGFSGHTFAWETILLIRQQLTQLGVRSAMSRGQDNLEAPCVDERIASANGYSPNAILSLSVIDEPYGSGFTVEYSKPPLNSAQAGPSVSFAEMMRDQLKAAGLEAMNQISSDGLYGVATVPELNLAQYPAIKVLLGNVSDSDDAQAMQTEEGRKRYADAVVKGVVAFLQTQPPRR